MAKKPHQLTGVTTPQGPQTPPPPPTTPPPPAPPQRGDQNGGNQDNKFKNLAWFIGAIFAALYAFGAWLAWGYSATGGIQWWAIVLTLAFCHLVLGSIKIIREQEMAVLIFAGIILKEWKSGPHYAVWPFFYVRRATRNSIQVDFGTLDEDTVARADRSEESISWFVMREPIRINWGDFKSLRLTPPGILIPSEDKIKEYNEDLQKRYANDPYANTLTTDPHLFFRFRIFNLQWLIERVGGLDEAMERIKDTCVSSLSEEAGKTFVAKARQELDSLSDNIHLSVEKLVGDPDAIRDDKCEAADSWGIDIEEVKIKDIGAPRTSNVALAQRAADIANADGKATATIRAAGAEKIRLVETAEGEATATERKATAERKRLEEEGTGRANALKVVAEQASTRGGELVLKTDTLKEVMTANEGKIVIVPTDLSGLTGAILGAVEAVKTPPGGGPKNPPAPSR